MLANRREAAQALSILPLFWLRTLQLTLNTHSS
jgi:hypothetical protein